MTSPGAPRTRDLATAELTTAESGQIRALLWAAFEPDDAGFSEDDWQHALGGRHFLVEVGDEIVAHAAVVARTIEIGGRPLRAGDAEAVGPGPPREREGHGAPGVGGAGGHNP